MLGDIGETRGVSVREWLEECGIDKGEDGDAGSDAESKHENCREGEARTAAKLAKGVTDVLQQGFEKGNGAAFAMSLPGAFDATKFEESFVPGLFG